MSQSQAAAFWQVQGPPLGPGTSHGGEVGALVPCANFCMHLTHRIFGHNMQDVKWSRNSAAELRLGPSGYVCFRALSDFRGPGENLYYIFYNDKTMSEGHIPSLYPHVGGGERRFLSRQPATRASHSVALSGDVCSCAYTCTELSALDRKVHLIVEWI